MEVEELLFAAAASERQGAVSCFISCISVFWTCRSSGGLGKHKARDGLCTGMNGIIDGSCGQSLIDFKNIGEG